MRPRWVAAAAAAWVTLAGIALLFAPGRVLALTVFPWMPWNRTAPLLGPGTPYAAVRLAALLIAAIVLAWGAAAAGAGLLRWLRFRALGAGERFAVAVLLGLAGCGGAFLGIGLAGLFHPVILVVAAAGLGVAGGRAGWPRPAAPERPPTAAAVVIVFVALQFVPYWFCPETDQDAFNFHLALPDRFLRLHRVVLDPLTASTYAFRSSPLEMVYALPVAAGADAVARLIHGLALVAGLALVFGDVSRRAGAGAGWLAVALCIAPLSLANVAARSKNDLAAASAAVGAWLVWLEAPRVPARLVASAALAGCAIAFKATAAALVVPWLLCAGIGAIGAGRLGMAGWAASLVALPIVPWLARTWLAAGDPVYPHLSPRWFPGLEWTEANRELDRGVFRYMSYRGGSFGSAVAGIARLDSPFLLALLPAAVVLRRLPAVAAGAALISWTAAVAIQPVARYTIPAVWLGCAVLVPAVFAVRAGRILRPAALALAVLPAVFRFPAAMLMADDRARVGTPWPYLLGGESRDAFLDARLTTYRQMARALSGLVPPGRAVLLHSDARTYGLPCRAMRGQEDADDPVMRQIARASATPGGIARRLRQLDVAALTANPVIGSRYLTEVHPLAWDDRALALYRDFVCRRVSAVWQSASEDDLNGAFVVICLGGREGAPRPVPLLPATEPVWSRAAFRMAVGRGVPNREVEREVAGIRAMLPLVGESAYRFANYLYVTGQRGAAAPVYRQALAEGWVDGMLLARYSFCLPPGSGRDRVLARLRARCGEGSAILLSDAARWVK